MPTQVVATGRTLLRSAYCLARLQQLHTQFKVSLCAQASSHQVQLQALQRQLQYHLAQAEVGEFITTTTQQVQQVLIQNHLSTVAQLTLVSVALHSSQAKRCKLHKIMASRPLFY